MLITLISIVLSVLNDKFFVGKREVKPTGIYKCFNYLPSIVLLVCTWQKLQIYPLWAFDKPGVFLILLFIIAVAPQILGIVVDVPICWKKFGSGPIFPLGKEKFKELMDVSKWGDKSIAKNGERQGGRFELNVQHISYNIMSNVSGALCSATLFAFTSTLPGFKKFVETADWSEYFEIALGVAMIISLSHASNQQNRQQPTDFSTRFENPHIFRLDRLHMASNIVHLCITIAYCLMTSFYMIIYGLFYWRSVELNDMYLGCIGAVMLFLWVANASPWAFAYQAVSWGNWLTGPAIVAIAAPLYSLCYKFSYVHVWTFFLSILVFFLWIIIRHVWNKQRVYPKGYQVSIFFSIGFLAVIMVFVCGYVW